MQVQRLWTHRYVSRLIFLCALFTRCAVACTVVLSGCCRWRASDGNVYKNGDMSPAVIKKVNKVRQGEIYPRVDVVFHNNEKRSGVSLNELKEKKRRAPQKTKERRAKRAEQWQAGRYLSCRVLTA